MAIFLLVLLPVLSFLSGILGLQSDPQTERRKRSIVVVVLALTAIGSVTVSIVQQQSDSREKTVLRQYLDAIQGSTTQTANVTVEIKTLLLGILGKNGAAPALIQTLNSSPGLSADDVKLAQQSVTADEAVRTLQPVVTAENKAHPTNVVYYPKDVDPSNVNGPALISLLSSAGFNVRPAQGGERNPNLATNAVWAAENVPIDQVKFVTLTLMRAGLRIRAIRSFRSAPDGTPRKPDTIEIGADAQIQKDPPLLVDQVQAMTALPKR